MNSQHSPGGNDLDAMAAMIGRAAKEDPGPIVPWSLLEDLAELIPADEVAIADLDLVERAREVQQTLIAPHGVRDVSRDVDEADVAQVFWRHYGRFWTGSPSSRSGQVRRWSDPYSERELRRQPLYCELFRPVGVKHFLSVGFPTTAGHERNLMFFRSDGSDFSDREKQILQLLRPHLVEIHATAARQRLGVLTPREWQVLELVAEGHSNADIAALLFMSVSTVRKHMEHIFDHAGVRNRSAAVARMMPDSRGFDADPTRH